MAANNFFTGLLGGIASSLDKRKEQEESELRKKLVDAQLKTLKIQSDLAERSRSAQKQLMDLANPPGGAFNSPSTPPPPPDRPLGDVISENQGLALQSGGDFSDIAKKSITGEIANAQTAALFRQLSGQPGGSGGNLGPPSLSVAPGGVTARFSPQKINFDNDGRATNDQGGSVPTLDKVIPSKTALTMRNDAGELPVGLTMDQALDNGFRPVPQSERGKVSTADAGRIALAEEGISNVDRAEALIFPEGEIDAEVIALMAVPGGGIGRGREPYSLIEQAVRAKILAQTGATARIEEVRAAMRAHMPSLLDLAVPGLPERKMQGLRSFLESQLDITTLPPSLQKRIKARRAKEKPTLQPKERGVLGSVKDALGEASEAIKGVLNFSDLPD